MPARPDVEASLARLRAAGWSSVEGSWAFPGGKRVYGVVVAKGRRRLVGEGRGVKAAGQQAREQALGRAAGAD
jgi:hypothetical protein